MSCCAIAPGCGRSDCRLCTVIAKLPQQSVRDARRKGETATRSGTAAVKRRDPTFTRRPRKGPHR